MYESCVLMLVCQTKILCTSSIEDGCYTHLLLILMRRGNVARARNSN